MEIKIRTFSGMQTLKEFITIRPALQELFKEVIQKKENNTNWKVNKAEMGNMWINLRGFVFT